MTKAVQKITLSPSRDIPFNKLVLSQSNVRHVKAGVSIEQLAESIAPRTPLQSLNVRAVVGAEGERDRHVRGAGRRPALSRARTACESRSAWRRRKLFLASLPTDASGVEILSKVLDSYPIARIGEREAA